jgi:hypothetical protein
MLLAGRVLRMLAVNVMLAVLSCKHSAFGGAMETESKEVQVEVGVLDPKVKGGLARAEALTPEQRSDIARGAAMARWTKSLPRATHEGPIKIRGGEIQSAVLDDGRRVITQSGFMVALGRARQAKGRSYYDADVNMPAFLTAKNLKPFVPSDLGVTSSQIEFRTLRGVRAFGYSAELLPQVCGVFMDAQEAGALTRGQLHIAQKAKVLMRGLATTGIIALVDEATGFQYERDRTALQVILNRYLSVELAAWAKRFPDEFYDELFRLRGWKWERKGSRRPVQVAKDTINLVYMRMLPDLLKELEVRNPKDERGRRKAKHHQFFSVDIGSPALNAHVHAIITLMRAFDTWDEFKGKLDRSLPVVTRLSDLPLFNQSEGTTEPTLPDGLSLADQQPRAS